MYLSILPLTLTDYSTAGFPQTSLNLGRRPTAFPTPPLHTWKCQRSETYGI
jgi:hypothetical protein